MKSRFLSNVALALAGGFLVVASQVFGTSVLEWLALAMGLGALALVGAVQVDRMRGNLQRAFDILAGALGVWTVVASVVFVGSALTWLSFAEGLGFVGLALVGIFAHELSTERVVHALDVPAETRRESEKSERFSTAA